MREIHPMTVGGGDGIVKAAIYCRLSEEDRNKHAGTDDSASIQNQKTMLLQYAMEQGWDVYRIYSDDDYAGADRRRPEFNRLLEDAENRKFDIVLCKTQSRFTRELELVEKYIHGLFPAWGIRFVSIVDNADTANKGNKKSRQINGLVNEWYLEDMSDNIKSVLTNRRKNGLHIGSSALYGYRKDPKQKGHLIVDEEAAAVVREVFTLFAGGYGKTAIARMLNDRGVPNPTEYKRLCGLLHEPPAGKSGTLWKYSAIANMLKNRIYIGDMVQGRYGSVSYKTKQNKPRPQSEWYVVEGTHEPIIDLALWERVQAMLRQRAKPFSEGEIGLFARKARCANCGCTMRSSKNRGRHYLQCANRHAAKDACIGSFISVDKLETEVTGELNRLAGEYLDREELERKTAIDCGASKRLLMEEKAHVRARSAACEKKLEEYGRALRELYLDKVRGSITDRDFEELSQNFSSEKIRLEYAIMEEKRREEKLEKRIEEDDGRREPAERYARIEHLNREMVEVLIDYIAVGRRLPGTKEVPIEIHWNF